ncbi:MAG: DUF6356 family protein [Gammaproteobacteria bacterium]|nr:DUF6356 family protein [Gammaproteobacteria bacterium]
MITKSRRHLAAVNESYFHHQRFAFRYAFDCFRAGAMAFVHGLVPALFETAASDLVKKLAGMGRSRTEA